MNSILPTSLIATSIVVLFVYVMPQYSELQAQKQNRQEYIETMDQITKLKNKFNDAKSARSSITQGDLKRIDTVIPDTFDNVKFLLDLNRIAVQKGVTLGTVDIKKNTDEKAYVTYSISFAFDAPFSGNIDSFMSALETSLILFDVQNLTMKSTEKGLITYDLTFNTYAKK